MKTMNPANPAAKALEQADKALSTANSAATKESLNLILGPVHYDETWAIGNYLRGAGLSVFAGAMKEPTVTSFDVFTGAWHSISLSTLTVGFTPGGYMIRVMPENIAGMEYGKSYLVRISYSI